MRIQIRELKVVISIYRRTNTSQMRPTPGEGVWTYHAGSWLAAPLRLHISRWWLHPSFHSQKAKGESISEAVACTNPVFGSPVFCAVILTFVSAFRKHSTSPSDGSGQQGVVNKRVQFKGLNHANHILYELSKYDPHK